MSYERDAYDAARALSLHRMTDGELRQHAAGGEAMAAEVLAERFCEYIEPHNCDECGELYDEASGDGYCGLCPSCADTDCGNCGLCDSCDEEES